MEPVSITALIMSVGSLAGYLMKKMLKKRGKCASKTAVIISELHSKLSDELYAVISQEVAKQLDARLGEEEEEDVVVLPRGETALSMTEIRGV